HARTVAEAEPCLAAALGGVRRARVVARHTEARSDPRPCVGTYRTELLWSGAGSESQDAQERDDHSEEKWLRQGMSAGRSSAATRSAAGCCGWLGVLGQDMCPISTPETC